MPTTLHNKRILVTRPKEQVAGLTKLISEHGGVATLFPTIDIQAVATSPTLLAQFNTINQYDYVVFISRNAVQFAFNRYLYHQNIANTTQVVAIGDRTALALADLGQKNVLHAGSAADSETLLRLPEMQPDQLRGKKILIVRGIGGREVLAHAFMEYGAIVDYAEIYERRPCSYKPQFIRNIWLKKKPNAIIITNYDGLKNLVHLTLDDYQEELFATPLVTMSARLISIAKSLGFTSQFAAAKTRNDEGLLAALIDIFGRQQDHE